MSVVVTKGNTSGTGKFRKVKGGTIYCSEKKFIKIRASSGEIKVTKDKKTVSSDREFSYDHILVSIDSLHFKKLMWRV